MLEVLFHLEERTKWVKSAEVIMILMWFLEHQNDQKSGLSEISGDQNPAGQFFPGH